MSKLLKEVLKTSILPTALLITGKFLGLYLAVLFYNEALAITHEHKGLYSVQVLLQNSQHVRAVNSLADLILLIIVVGTYLFIAIRYLIYIRASGSPRTIIRLARFNLLDWIVDKNNALVKFTVWSVYTIMVGSVLLVNSLTGVTSNLLGLLGILTSVFVILTLLKVFELESSKVAPL